MIWFAAAAAAIMRAAFSNASAPASAMHAAADYFDAFPLIFTIISSLTPMVCH